MSLSEISFQPGAILHEAIIGAFHAHGGSFDHWCKANGIQPSSARNATFGQSRGSRGNSILNALIDAAGRDYVVAAYSRRTREHAASLPARAFP
ncbi:MAG: hypothetical protein CML43_09545 [Rhodobacteraceae bacterium]|nr:hypothetical protein [Paracoccaceae bacterium]